MYKSARILVGIPTRDRPEYLACLLSSLLFQTDRYFDVLVVDTSTADQMLVDSPIVSRFADTLRALGNHVRFEKVEASGRSEVVAVNRILVEAQLQGYGFVYKVDDDHVLPANTLATLRKNHAFYSKSTADILLSGVTPWMAQVFPGAASPHDLPRSVSSLGARGVSYIDEVSGSEVTMEIGHFFRYAEDMVVRTELASAANFFLRPDTRILWSDICGSSKYADAVWFTQLREILQYQLYFLLGLNVWHVAAPTGGVREQASEFEKLSSDDVLRGQHLGRIYGELGVKNDEN